MVPTYNIHSYTYIVTHTYVCVTTVCMCNYVCILRYQSPHKNSRKVVTLLGVDGSPINIFTESMMVVGEADECPK